MLSFKMVYKYSRVKPHCNHTATTVQPHFTTFSVVEDGRIVGAQRFHLEVHEHLLCCYYTPEGLNREAENREKQWKSTCCCIILLRPFSNDFRKDKLKILIEETEKNGKILESPGLVFKVR